MDAGTSGQSLLRRNVLESICNMDVLDTMSAERFQKTADMMHIDPYCNISGNRSVTADIHLT